MTTATDAVDSMSIQDWGAVGEILGGIAVLVSLIYLALQVRQNTRELKRSIEMTELESFERNVRSANHVRELLIRDPDITKLFLRGLKGFSELGRVDRFRMDMLLRNVFTELQSAYVRMTTLGTKDGPTRSLELFLESRGVREWLNTYEPDWRPEFRQFVDERVAEITASDSAADGDASS